MTLPVADICDELLQTLHHQPVTVLTAPPGAGKSTYLPLVLLRDPAYAGRRIWMLEPRRLAAKSIAHYLAAQIGESVGQTVGYQIKAEQSSSSSTRLLIVTEGVFIRKILADPELASVDLLIFDEFHERAVQTDLALALALEAQQLNDQLRLLIMSATLDVTALCSRLQAPLVQSDGRSFPVDIRYQAPDKSDLSIQAAALALQACIEQQSSVLVFLAGQKEIRHAEQWLAAQAIPSHLQVFGLIGSMALAEQQQAIAPSPAGHLKIVLATNIAETSLTIDGIHVVVDTGLARAAIYQPKAGYSTLETVQISQASAIQRAGRAGRLAPGICYRLDTPEKWQRRAKQTTPDVLQADLLGLRLDIAGWGAQVHDLFWLDPPPSKTLAAAEWCLQWLGAMDGRGVLTAQGRKMAQLPLDPRLAAMLLYGQQLSAEGWDGATQLAAALAALLSDGQRFSQTDLSRQVRFSSDLTKRQYAQLCQLCQVAPVSSAQWPLQLLPALLSRAYPDRIALKRGQGYLLANGCGASLAPDDALQGAELLVVVDVSVYQQQAQIRLAVPWTVSELMGSWQAQLAWQTHAGFDAGQGRFVAEQQLRLGQLILARKPTPQAITPELRREAWLTFLSTDASKQLDVSDTVQQLQHRMALAKRIQPDGGWPDWSWTALQQELSNWLGPYLGEVRSLAELKQLQLAPLLLAQLSYDQRRTFEQLLPSVWQSSLGTQVALEYHADGEVVLAIRLQEMFGQPQSPTLANGAVPLTIHLLSPAKRPLQVTRDLASFWANAYQEVKKEMRGRYPKHYWPDNPMEAEPTNKTKKAMEYGSKTSR